MIISDIEKIKNRFRQFWKKENKTPLVSINAIKDKNVYYQNMEKLKADPRFKNGFYLKADPETKIKYSLEKFKNQLFLADTIPSFSSGIGPSMSSAYLGSPAHIPEKGGMTWFDHCISDYEKHQLEFDERNIWWLLDKSVVEYASRAAKENGCFTAIPVDLHSGIDTLMIMRGSEKLCMDLAAEPETVKRFSSKIMKYWKRWIDELFLIQHKNFEGNTIAWLNVWGPGRTFCIQSDFMSMISKEMYAEFILDDIREMCDYLDHTVFHFDGPDGTERHLDFLLEIDNLHAIQWNPTESCKNLRHLNILKRIQKAGKGLVLNTTSEELDTLLKELSPQGLLLNISPFREPFSENEALNLIEKYKLVNWPDSKIVLQ